MTSSLSFDAYQAELRLNAIISVLYQAEREGLRISREAQFVIERECIQLFEQGKVPIDPLSFSAILKDTAVRLFRQRRYHEANVRYRMASLFNPHDVTLVSNRATCMYNLKKFARCIDLCHACVTSFRTLWFENTALYIRLLVRLGHASIDLKNYDDAQTINECLAKIGESLKQKFGIEIDMDEYSANIVPFQRHLESSLNSFKDQDRKVLSRERRTSLRMPYDLNSTQYVDESNKQGSTAVEDEYIESVFSHRDEDDEDEDHCDDCQVNIDGDLEIDQLCPHVFAKGRGPCNHSFPQEGRDFHSNECSLRSSASSSPHSSSFSDEQDVRETDEEMPALLTSDAEAEDSESTSNYTGNDTDDSEKCVEFPRQNVNAYQTNSQQEPGHRARNHSGHESSDSRQERPLEINQLILANSSFDKGDRAHSKSASSALFRVSEQVKDLHASERKGTSSFPERKSGALLGSHDSSRVTASFRDGCSAYDSHFLRQEMQSFKKAFCEKGSIRKESFGISQSRRNENSVASYDTDKETISEDEVMRPAADNENILSMGRNGLPVSHCNDSERIKALLSDVFGYKFRDGSSVDSLDYTHVFGMHQNRIRSGKRKKLRCDTTCGPCFARKMWKKRFKSRLATDIPAYFGLVRSDLQDESESAVFKALFTAVGYYGSGYELCSPISAIVHGVAYIILLQSELLWRGDSVSLNMDFQEKFILAMEKHLTCSQEGCSLLAAIAAMLRETIVICETLANHRARGIGYIFQLNHTASHVASSRSDGDVQRHNSIPEETASLMSKTDNCLQNIGNWSTLRHHEREELWVYKALFKNVTNILYPAQAKLSLELKQGERKESTVHLKVNVRRDSASGEMPHIDRIIFVLFRQRSRSIERMSASRKGINLRRSALMLSRAIDARPDEPRLYYKRADVYAHQRKWKDCVRDLRRARVLLGKQDTEEQSLSRLSQPQTLLLLRTYSLEGDAHVAQNGSQVQDERLELHMAIDSYSRALEIRPKSRRMNASLQRKLRDARNGLKYLSEATQTCNSPVRRLASTPKSRKGASTKGKSIDESPVARSAQHSIRHQSQGMTINDDHYSSTDEESERQVIGNPYAVLLAPRTSGVQNIQNKVSRQTEGRCPSSSHEDRKYLSTHDENENGKSSIRRSEPTREEIARQIRILLVNEGGACELSEIGRHLNLRRWRIEDAGSYVERKYGDLYSFICMYGQLFAVCSSLSTDPVVSLHGEANMRTSGFETSDRKLWHAVPDFRADKEKLLSEKCDFSQIVSDLLQREASSRDQKSDEDECGICLDSEPDVQCLPCGHVWCDRCMKLYLAKKRDRTGAECPKCRGTIENVLRLTVD